MDDQIVRITLEKADRDVIVLALSHLSLDRPGWENYLRRVSEKVSDVGKIHFDYYRRLREEAVRTVLEK